MKIVFCTQNIAPFRMKWMDEIAKYHEVHVYHLNEYESGLNKKYISYKTERAKVFCETKKVAGKTIFDTSKILAEKPDVYLLDGYGFIGQILLMLRLWLSKIPFMLSGDGGIIPTSESFFKRTLKRFILSLPSAFFSTSEEDDNYLCHYGVKREIIKRHLFSNTNIDYIEEQPAEEEKKTRIRKELAMSDAFTIVTVGKFEHRKGFDLLIKAAERIEGNVKIYIIGNSDSGIYKDYINDKNRDKIVFVGFCDQDTLKKYYLSADLFLLPTRLDIWGLVICEAMANGIPVVTTDKCLAGIAMLEKDYLIPIEDVDAIVGVISRIYHMTPEQRRAIGERNIAVSREYAIENASIGDVKYLEDFSREYSRH